MSISSEGLWSYCEVRCVVSYQARVTKLESIIMKGKSWLGVRGKRAARVPELESVNIPEVLEDCSCSGWVNATIGLSITVAILLILLILLCKIK